MPVTIDANGAHHLAWSNAVRHRCCCWRQWPVFKILTARFGPRPGYFLAFVVYGLGWCTLFPLWAVGLRGIRETLGPGNSRFGRHCLALDHYLVRLCWSIRL